MLGIKYYFIRPTVVVVIVVVVVVFAVFVQQYAAYSRNIFH